MYRITMEGHVSNGRFIPPVSKSDAVRATIIAHIRGLDVQIPADPPEDVSLTLAALERLSSDAAELYLHMGLGGAPLRFAAALAAVTPGKVCRIDAAPQLRARPHLPLLEALQDGLGDSGVKLDVRQWPLRIDTTGAEYTQNVEFTCSASSSQYISALLIAGASLLASGLAEQVRVTIDGALSSESYLKLTIEWLHNSGFAVVEDGRSLLLKSSSPADAAGPVPLDWSSAAYLAVLAWKTGGTVEVSPDSNQADRQVFAAFSQAGLRIEQQGNSLSVAGKLEDGFICDAGEAPDGAVLIGAMAAFAPGPSEIRNCGILRDKESDRLAFIEAVCKQLGARASEEDGNVLIEPVSLARLPELTISSSHDHRRVMASACLLAMGCPAIICDAVDCVAKSFPGFWREAGKAGIKVQTIEEDHDE